MFGKFGLVRLVWFGRFGMVGLVWLVKFCRFCLVGLGFGLVGFVVKTYTTPDFAGPL